MARASKMNRGYSGGLAAGAPAGTGFQSSFQSSMAPMAPPAPRAPMAPMAEAVPMAPMAPMPAPTQPPPVDFSNMFSPPPLPAPGQQSFNQPPPAPFGPAPLPFGGFRQEGGPVQPGLAYIVGEAGPELIVPQQPGMVLPNPTLTGRASAQDGAVRSGPLSTRASAQDGAVRSGPLSTRGATPVGSGRGMTPERRLEIAARRGDQRANLALFNADQFGRNQRGAARALPPPMPMPMGRAPLAMTRPMPMQEPAMEMMPMPAQPQAQTAPQFDMSNMLPPMAPAMLPPQPAQAPFRPQGPRLDPMAPLPPSTLMGGSGVPPPPRFSEVSAGGMNLIVDNDTGKQVAAYKPEPNRSPPTFEMRRDATGAFRQFYDGQPIAGEPTYSGQVVPGSYVRRETQGQPAPIQYTPNLPQPTERVTVDAEGKQTRTFTQPRGATPAPAPGPAGGAAPIERTTSSGVKVQVSMPDQAGRMTGQMPNEAYANPLTPEQSLAAARAEYLATGNDAALQKHFQQFPSQAVQLNRQEGQVWNQIGQNVGNYQQELIGVANALEDRNRFINANAMGALGAGAAAIDYGRMQPAINRRAARDLPPLNPDLIARAGELNQQAQAASALSNPVLMAQAMPPVTPRLNPTRRSF